MLHLKRSLDVKRQRATWELGVILHQNESQGGCINCSWLRPSVPRKSQRPKPITKQLSWRPRQPNNCLIQAAEATCSKAISNAKAQTTSQAVIFQEEHCNYLWGLEEQALGVESRSHQDILSSCQATLCYSPQLVRGMLAASYHLHIGTNTSIAFTCPVPKDPSHGRTDILSHSSYTDAQTVSETKKVTSFARADGGHRPLHRATPAAAVGGPPHPKK